MRMQPRRRLLEIWEDVAAACFADGTWRWPEGPDGERDSICDAYQLLTLLYPACELASFRLDSPDQAADDVLEALRPLGDGIEVAKLLLRLMADYLRTHTDDGEPVFTGPSRLSAGDHKLTDEQRRADLTEAFALSVTLTLDIIGFVRVFRASVTREEIRREIRDLEILASTRLSAAMVGLLRSFNVEVFEPQSSRGALLARTVNQTGASDRLILDQLQQALREVRARLRDLTIGSGSSVDLDNPNLLFECGWSWGVIRGAPTVVAAGSIPVSQRRGVADTPLIHASATVIPAVLDLLSPRTRVLGLLDDEQQRLASALQLRMEATCTYWETVALFGDGPWPLEDTPWRMPGGVESESASLAVFQMAMRGLRFRRDRESAFDRVVGILEELALTARITKRPGAGDPATALHVPGFPVALPGSDELGPPLVSHASPFAPALLQRVIVMDALMQGTGAGQRMQRLADRIWTHLEARRIAEGPGQGLWDDARTVFAAAPAPSGPPSWAFTFDVVALLVTAAATTDERPPPDPQLVSHARALLREADHMLEQELMLGLALRGRRPLLGTIEARLRRAREIHDSRPAAAIGLVNSALTELDALLAAREWE
ncbi:hypothetical protein J5X84_01745 [Streptosporangiaceae bacterium NEAU-GS5]|nr:hypothetical protein [Streptosporangiaceae bacterium NEAU-GS5]